MELKTPGRGRGVDLFGQRAKADLAVVQILDRVDQVFEAAAKPIQAPDHERVPRGEELKAGVELGAMAQRPRADIAKHAPAPGLLERIELQREVLIVRRHARIADQLVAGGPPAPGAATSGRGWALPGRSHAVGSSQKSRTRTLEPTPNVRLASETTPAGALRRFDRLTRRVLKAVEYETRAGETPGQHVRCRDHAFSRTAIARRTSARGRKRLSGARHQAVIGRNRGNDSEL